MTSAAPSNATQDASAFASLVQRESALLRSAPPPEASALQVDDALSYGAALKGKVVVVTGAGSGFGRAYARKVGELGCVAFLLSQLRRMWGISPSSLHSLVKRRLTPHSVLQGQVGPERCPERAGARGRGRDHRQGRVSSRNYYTSSCPETSRR